MIPKTQDLREDALLLLLALIDRIILPDSYSRCSHTGRGRKQQYPDKIFLKASVIMTMKRLTRVFELLTTLEEPTEQMQVLRQHLTHDNKIPTRRTFERRLTVLTEIFSALIARLGAFLVILLDVWQAVGRASAMDSMVLRAKDNAVWHKKDQETGEVPHSRIDTQAGWTKSGWRGWVYGWKLLEITRNSNCR